MCVDFPRFPPRPAAPRRADKPAFATKGGGQCGSRNWRRGEAGHQDIRRNAPVIARGGACREEFATRRSTRNGGREEAFVMEPRPPSVVSALSESTRCDMSTAVLCRLRRGGRNSRNRQPAEKYRLSFIDVGTRHELKTDRSFYSSFVCNLAEIAAIWSFCRQEVLFKLK